MKKILALSVASLCAFSMVGSTFAEQPSVPESTDINAEYTLGSAYTVVIPAGIVFTKADTSVEETVSASGVMIDRGGYLNVSMSSANGKLMNGDSYVPYSFTLDETTTEIAKDTDYELLVINSGDKDGDSKDLTFTAGNLDHVTAAGRHVDTLTFTIEVINPPKFANKKIDVLGDSITAGASYFPTLKTLTGASSIVNHGISGQTLPNFAARVTELDSNADLIIVFGGTNDYWHKTENIGTISDTSTSTFYGAMNSIYNQLTANYSGAQYLFVFPPHQTFSGDNDTTDFGHGTFADFASAMETFCASKGIKYLDLRTIEDWNPATDSGDGVHPNSAGGVKIANAMHNFIQANF